MSTVQSILYSSLILTARYSFSVTAGHVGPTFMWAHYEKSYWAGAVWPQCAQSTCSQIQHPNNCHMVEIQYIKSMWPLALYCVKLESREWRQHLANAQIAMTMISCSWLYIITFPDIHHWRLYNYANWICRKKVKQISYFEDGQVWKSHLVRAFHMSDWNKNTKPQNTLSVKMFQGAMFGKSWILFVCL